MARCQQKAAPVCVARLLIEFPENAEQLNTQDTRNLIERLGAPGCRFGLGQFGRSFRSFAYLRTMKRHYLKINSRYTHHINRENDNRFLVHSLTDTTHNTDIAVIAQSI
jgi:EAL domain-containing protein (putative c-di-GMP-specific phosphodiesterase class I)